MSVVMMHVAGPKVKSVFSFCFFSALRRGWVCRHLALGLVQNRRVVRSRVFAASLRRHSALGLVSRSRASLPLRPRARDQPLCLAPPRCSPLDLLPWYSSQYSCPRAELSGMSTDYVEYPILHSSECRYHTYHTSKQAKQKR